MVQYRVDMADALNILNYTLVFFFRIFKPLRGLALSYWWDYKGIVYFEYFKAK